MCHSVYFTCSVDLDILCSGPFSGEKYQPSLPTLLQVVKMKRQMTFQTTYSPTTSNFNSNTQDVHPGGLSDFCEVDNDENPAHTITQTKKTTDRKCSSEENF